MSVRNLASCIAYLGKSGSGKSTMVKRRLAADKPSRLVIWSPDEDEDRYQDLDCVRCVVRTIPWMVEQMHAKEFAIVFWPSLNSERRAAEFDYFCRLVFEGKDMTCVVEELRYVTKPTFAPEPWSILSSRGRKKGIRVIGTSQRPAQIDKDFLGNTTEIITGALKYPADRKAVAEAMIIPIDEVDALEPLHYIRTGDGIEKEAGTITF